jgi:hypothetical protein
LTFNLAMLIHHVTLATGDTVTHRLDTLDAGAVDACRALLPDGGQIPGFAAYRVEIHGPVFTVYRGREPLVTCGLGTGDDDVWRCLCELQRKFCPVATSPPDGQWLAVVLLPSLANTPQADLGWLGDFERCLAAAMLIDGKPDLLPD